MRIAVLGGGPGGLYASLLLKQADPSREITVFEQNPPNASYGWGVVFSDTTLAEFREADPYTYRRITDRFVRWDAIDIRFREVVVRARGQPFAGVRRTDLLGILQDRCRDLGVDLRFEDRIEDPASLEGHDLIVAADGVHSVVRPAGDFGASYEEGRARYIWFGAEVPLDSFTFSFRQSEPGLFQAHAYPFDGTTSTFIVECHEDVWRKSGLDRATAEDSIAFCEDLFAEDLRGRPLLSNDSTWISFLTVRNRRWRDGRTVLLGDAAHTAHFSIGSGTKLAMEDAIALAEAFERHPGAPDAALRDYEAERRPRVELFQEAAAQSQRWFERVARSTHMEPEQFAFHLLTRSGRIDYANLRLRDPRLIARVDAVAAGGGAGPLVSPPPLFRPLSLRGATLSNRVALRPASASADESGTPSAAALAALVEAARGGPGLVLASAAVSPQGRVSPADPTIHASEHLEAWGGGVAAVRAETRAAVGLTIGHAGPRGATRPRSEGVDRPLAKGGWPLLAASPHAYGPGLPAPREMDRGDMDRVLGEFVEAADRARRAGFDLLLVHMAQGGLLASFLSPLTNRRDDRYGGRLDGRVRFPLEVFDAVRAAWPKERPLGAVITADDWAPGGSGIGEALDVAGMLRDGGCDLIQPLAGQTVWRTLPTYGRAYLAPYADRIRNETGVPTLVGGAISALDEVNTLVAAGRADLCVLEA